MDSQALEQMQSPETAAALTRFGLGMTIVELAILVVMAVAMWRLFTKAGKPGWAALIPIYNVVVLLEVVQRPIWWIVLMLIPIVNLVIAIVLCFDIAKVFGRGAGFGIGILFLSVIFLPILAFGSSKYVGRNASSAGTQAAAA